MWCCCGDETFPVCHCQSETISIPEGTWVGHSYFRELAEGEGDWPLLSTIWHLILLWLWGVLLLQAEGIDSADSEM